MKLGLSLILFTACATTGTTTMEPREPGPHARIELDLAAPAPDRAPFPAAIDPTMPSVDRIAHQLRYELGDAIHAALDLCVAPDGRVTKVALVEPTKHEAIDAAILRDAREWQFASRPGSTAASTLQTCERASLTYLMPR